MNLSMMMASRHNSNLKTTLKPKILKISSMRVTSKVMAASVASVDLVKSVAMVAMAVASVVKATEAKASAVMADHNNDLIADTLTQEETVDMAHTHGEQTSKTTKLIIPR